MTKITVILILDTHKKIKPQKITDTKFQSTSSSFISPLRNIIQYLVWVLSRKCRSLSRCTRPVFGFLRRMKSELELELLLGRRLSCARPPNRFCWYRRMLKSESSNLSLVLLWAGCASGARCGCSGEELPRSESRHDHVSVVDRPNRRAGWPDNLVRVGKIKS